MIYVKAWRTVCGEEIHAHPLYALTCRPMEGTVQASPRYYIASRKAVKGRPAIQQRQEIFGTLFETAIALDAEWRKVDKVDVEM